MSRPEPVVLTLAFRVVVDPAAWAAEFAVEAAAAPGHIRATFSDAVTRGDLAEALLAAWPGLADVATAGTDLFEDAED